MSRGEFSKQFFLLGYVEEGRCGLYKAPIKEERRRQAAKGERDKIKLIDLVFERSPE